MTAEIALLNRRALAFAADSAVTISDGSTDKIYNSAEKIFEISRKVPIGLMLFNGMEFMGVPLDVLARRFRTEHDEYFSSCKEACSKFLDFLKTFKRTLEDECDHLEMVFDKELREIKAEHKSTFPQEVSKLIKDDPGKIMEIDALAQRVLYNIVEKHISKHEARPLAGFLTGVSFDEFQSKYGHLAEKVWCKHFQQIPDDEELKKNIPRLCLSLVKSDVFSDNLTGLVFGGFSNSEIFPSLYSVEIDGIFFEQIKCKETNNIDIDRSGERASIVPFAQSEMVERFVLGIDAELEDAILKFVSKSSGRALKKVKEAGVDPDALGLNPTEYAGDVGRLLSRLKDKARQEILDMVDFMPKQELAYAAESMISLTSIKRKVSYEQETVGGPIDVAVITKNEGFVWIKRKHYFEKDLNPAYSVRAFRETMKGEG